MQEKRALGKGLSSLIPMGNRSDSQKTYMECDLPDVIPNPNQPRKIFNKSAIDELAASIEEKGILQPLIVRRMGGGKYELIAGERRYRAAQQLQLEKVPVIIKEVEDNDVFEIALIENIQRENLNPVEEALAYKDLLGKYQYTQDELAKRLGRDRSSIANTLRLLKLPENVRAYLITDKLSMGHARALLAVENRELQQKMAEQIIENDLSVREVEAMIRRLKDMPQESTSEAAPENNPAATIQKVRPNFKNLEDEIEKIVKTRVQIKSAGEKGKIILHYHSQDEFNRLYQSLTQATPPSAY